MVLLFDTISFVLLKFEKKTNIDVVFGIDNLGKEELLAKLATEFNTMCVVSPDRLRWIHMCDLPDVGVDDDERQPLFTDIALAGRFSVEPRRSVTRERFFII